MSSKKQPVRVMVVDDDPLIQAGIKGVLESDSSIFVVASATSGTEALDLIDAYRPDVLLLDIQMPGLTGLDVLRKVRQRPQRLACVIVTTFGEDDYVLEAVRFDADGFVLKAGDPSLLLTAVHAVAEGGAFFSPSVARRLLSPERIARYAEVRAAVEKFGRLTSREQEVLVRLSRGATNSEIAQSMHLAPGTIKAHVSSILRTTGARNRVEASLIAIYAKESSL